MPTRSSSKVSTSGNAKAAIQRVYVYSTKSTLAFIEFSLIPQFPDARPLYLLFPVVTTSPHPHTPRSFLSLNSNVIFSEWSSPIILPHIKLSLPKPFLSINTLCFILSVVLTNIRNYVMYRCVYYLSFPTGI